MVFQSYALFPHLTVWNNVAKLDEASQSLRAGPFQTFFRVTLPLILPGVLSGWIFAFIISLGELNTAIFLTSPFVKTLPIELFGYLQFDGDRTIVAAASTVQICLIIMAMVLIEMFTSVNMRRSVSPATGRVRV
jgi:putative spermidine/putrescine transport system permease protein